MKRSRQTLESIIESLSAIEASWQDDHANSVITLIEKIPDKNSYSQQDLAVILDQDFKAGLTAIRLILEMSQDELTLELRAMLGKGGAGKTRYRQDKTALLSSLIDLGILDLLKELSREPITWRNLLVERLKAGRGSAIKGQQRGRYLEDFTESIVKRIFHEVGYDTRCRFVGANGTSTEKADFAIPSKKEARILIEVKAYGATGSK